MQLANTKKYLPFFLLIVYCQLPIAYYILSGTRIPNKPIDEAITLAVI